MWRSKWRIGGGHPVYTTPKNILNRHDLNFLRIYKSVKNGTLDSSSELLKVTNLTKSYDVHKDDTSFEFYRTDLMNVLHYAVLFNRLRIVELFLDLNIDVNVRTVVVEIDQAKMGKIGYIPKKVYNDTPLHIASREGFHEIIECLLRKKDVNPEILNNSDQKAVDVAKTREVKQLLIDYETRKEKKEVTAVEIHANEAQKKWDLFKNYLSQDVDFTIFKNSLNQNKEELVKIQENLEHYRSSLDNHIDKLRKEILSSAHRKNPPRNEIRKKTQKRIPAIKKKKKKKKTIPPPTPKKPVGSYVVSVCKEVNFFNPRNGEWEGSYSLPQGFGSDTGINDFSLSIWKEKTKPEPTPPGPTSTSILSQGRNQNRRQQQRRTRRRATPHRDTESLVSDYEKNEQRKLHAIVMEDIREMRSDIFQQEKVEQQEQTIQQGPPLQINSNVSTEEDIELTKKKKKKIVPCKNCQISPTQLALGDGNGSIYITDFMDQKELDKNFVLHGHSNQITSIASTYDPKYHISSKTKNLLVSGSYSSEICLWDLDKRKNRHVFQYDDLHASEINDLQFFPSGFVSASSDGFVKLVDLEKNRMVGSYEDHKFPVSCLSNTRGGEEEQILFSGGFDRFVRFYDMRRNSGKSNKFIKLEDAVTSLCFSGQKNMVVVGYGFGDICGVDYRMISSNEDERRGMLWNIKSQHVSQINKIISLYAPHHLVNKEIEEEEEEEEEVDEDLEEDFLFASCGNDGFINLCSFSQGRPRFKILERQSCYGIVNFMTSTNFTLQKKKIEEEEEEESNVVMKWNHNNEPLKPHFSVNLNSHSQNILLLNEFRKKKDEEIPRTTSTLLSLFRPTSSRKKDPRKYEKEFISNLIDRNVLDGRIFKIIQVVNRLKNEREKIREMKSMVRDQTGKNLQWMSSQFTTHFARTVRPYLKKVRAEKALLREATTEFITEFVKIKNFARLEFLKRTASLFKKMINKEKQELKDLKKMYRKNLKKMFSEMKLGITKFASQLQSMFSQRRILSSKFSRREDLRLKYSKSDFNRLKKRVGEIKDTIRPLHENIVKEYHYLLALPVFRAVPNLLVWKHERYSQRIIGVIECFQEDKKRVYLGEIFSGMAHGKGVEYIEGKKKSLVIRGKCYTMVYDGEFHQNKRQGKGLEYTDEKIVYEGLFRDGYREGKGIRYDLSGKQCVQGVWMSGKLTNQKSDSIFDFEIIHFEEIQDQLIPANELGKGANGVVYRVEYEGKECAAKILDLKLIDRVSKSRIRHYIRRSLRLCASFDHPNVIQVHGMISGHPDKIGYVMEKCSHSVSEEMFRKNLSFKEKILILYETARGMWYLHERNIMNRDLKWDNVLVRAGLRTEVVLTDFDTAKEDESIWKNSVQNTASSVGTPVFIAPEVLSKRYGLSVDVYSYGIMIHSLIFGLLNPYSETEVCPCGQSVRNITPYSFPYHIKNCNLRPLLDDKKKRAMKEHEWLLELMQLCYSTNPLQRPNFTEICAQIEKRMNNMIEKRVRIIIRGLEDEPPETYIMLDTSYQAVTNKITYRWKGHDIVNLYYLKRGNTAISQQQREEVEVEVEVEEKKLTVSKDGVIVDESGDAMIPLYDDETFIEFLSKSNVTTIVVEFETVPETEKGKLKKELQELAEQYEAEKKRIARSHRMALEDVRREMKEQKGDIQHLRQKNEKYRKLISVMQQRKLSPSPGSPKIPSPTDIANMLKGQSKRYSMMTEKMTKKSAYVPRRKKAKKRKKISKMRSKKMASPMLFEEEEEEEEVFRVSKESKKEEKDMDEELDMFLEELDED